MYLIGGRCSSDQIIEKFWQNSHGIASASCKGTCLRNFQFCMWWGELLKAKVFHLFLGCYSYPSSRNLSSSLWGALVFIETTQEGFQRILSYHWMYYIMCHFFCCSCRSAGDLLVSYKGLRIICLSCKITFIISYLFL